MSDNQNSLMGVKARLATAIGQTVWGAALGVGSFVTLEFGRSVEDSRGKVHGEFHLWIYCTAWRIESMEKVIASSEDAREELQTLVPQLNGKLLSGIDIDPISLSAIFSFVDGTALRTFSVFSKEYEHWMFYLPDDQVFSAGPGASWSWEK